MKLLKAILYGLKTVAVGIIKAIGKAFTGTKNKTVEFVKGPAKVAAKELSAKYKVILAEWLILTAFERGSKHCMKKVADAMTLKGMEPTYDDYDRLFETPVEKVTRINKLFDSCKVTE